jgi:hypothetical protein
MSSPNTIPDYPPQPEPTVEAAARDLPWSLQDMANETRFGAVAPGHGQRIVLAQLLVDALARRGHSRAAAAWAVHGLVQRGLLVAEVATQLERPVIGRRPDENSTVVKARRFFSVHADAPRYLVPVYGAPVRKPLAPPGQPIPYDCLLVRSTPALWEGLPAGAASTASAAAVASVEPRVPFIPSELQEAILAALNGKALTLDALTLKLHVDRSTLHRDGIKELRAQGLIDNHRRVGGYFRPDAPPPKYADRLGGKPA